MKRYSTYITIALLITAAILGAYGQSLISISAILLSLGISLWQVFDGNLSSRDSELTKFTTAQMMLRAGLGNVYSESAIHEIERDQTGTYPVEKLHKALESDKKPVFLNVGS